MSYLEYFIDGQGNLKSTTIKDISKNPHCTEIPEDREGLQGSKSHKEKSERYRRGYLKAQMILDEVEVHHIEIEPAYRRKGFAHQLLTHLIREVKAKGAIRIFLEVSIENDPALNLYHKLGFLTVGTRKGYYKTPDGALVDAHQMEKVL